MSLFIDVAYDSLNKYNEELCGDKVEYASVDEEIIIVISDGLGSGVKANILATLTTKIAATMLKKGEDLYDTIDTIINTLPICKERKIAYSTFTILKIDKEGNAYIAEYDNPPFFILRNSESLKIEKEEHIINDKKVNISTFKLQKDDVIVVVSDGVIHAGIGEVLNLGWKWEDVERYLVRNVKNKKCAKNISKDLIDVCFELYGGKPGDDTTVLVVKAREPQYVDLFTGPPEDKENDAYVIRQLIKGKGKKIICGGTAANIAERVLNRKVEVNLDELNCEVPPTSTMEGIDLITEGVLTLNKAVEKLNKYINSNQDKVCILNEEDGASKLIKVLIEDCTHLNLWIGKTVNPAHQNPNFDGNLNIKLKLIDELSEMLKRLGKTVIITYI